MKQIVVSTKIDDHIISVGRHIKCRPTVKDKNVDGYRSLISPGRGFWSCGPGYERPETKRASMGGSDVFIVLNRVFVSIKPLYPFMILYGCI